MKETYVAITHHRTINITAIPNHQEIISILLDLNYQLENKVMSNVVTGKIKIRLKIKENSVSEFKMLFKL